MKALTHLNWIALVALLCIPSGATAERADHPPKLLVLLSGIDTIPSPADLERACSEPQVALFRAAVDPELGVYIRRRATGLLAAYPDTVSESYLTHLATAMESPRLRWIATLTYITRWGKLPHANKRVLDFAEIMLQSPIALDRDGAVNGLRQLREDKGARALLVAHDKVEKDPEVRRSLNRALGR